MDQRLYSFYDHPDIKHCENVHLMSLAENCAATEEQLLAIMKTLPPKQQAVIRAYIDYRNDLEVESIKAAMNLRSYLQSL